MNIFTEMTKCLSFPTYRVFRSDTGGKNFLYLLVMSLIGFVLTVGVGLYIPFITMGGLSGIEENIPYFNMSDDGILTVDYKLSTVTDDNDLFIIDTDSYYTCDEESNILYLSGDSVTYEPVEDLNDYGRAIVVSAESFIICDNGKGETEELAYSDIPAEYLAKINITSLMELIGKFMIIFIICALLFSFIRLAVWNVVNAAVGACISSSMGVKNTFGQNYAMGLRAYTPMYLICCLLSAFHVGFPFKIIVMLLVTGFILSRGIKAVKRQLDEEEVQLSQMGMDSDLAYRAMYGENNAFEQYENNTDKNNI